MDEFNRLKRILKQGRISTNMELGPNISTLLLNEANRLKDKVAKLEKLAEELKNVSESSNKILLDTFRELYLENIC